MATKVKGGAIKEGSIPLSALSEEIKNKIENSGTGGGGATPDWNAEEGEASYIKNRTHYYRTYYSSEETLYANEDTVGTYIGGVSQHFRLGNCIYNSSDILNKEFNCQENGPSVIVKVVEEVVEDENEYYLYHVSGNTSNGLPITFIPYVQVKCIDDAYIPDTIARKSDLENLPNGSTKSKFQLYQENGGRFFTDENVYNIFDVLRNEHSDYYWDLEILQPLESGNTYTFDDLDLTYANFIGVIYGGRTVSVYINDDDAITFYNPGEPTDSYLWFESESAQLHIDLIAKTVEFNTWE